MGSRVGADQGDLGQLEACHPHHQLQAQKTCVAAVEHALKKQTAHKNVFVPEGKVPKLTVGGNTD